MAEETEVVPVAIPVAMAVTLPERFITILLESAGLSISARIAEASPEPEGPEPVVPSSVAPDPVIRMPPVPVALWSAYIARLVAPEIVPGPVTMMLPLPFEVASTPPPEPVTVPFAVTDMLPLVEVS